MKEARSTREEEEEKKLGPWIRPSVRTYVAVFCKIQEVLGREGRGWDGK